MVNMKNLKLELFSFKKKLNVEQDDILRIIDAHMVNGTIDSYSEKEIISSLNEKLNVFTYDKEVKSLLEDLNNDLTEYEIMYNLKHLYKIIEIGPAMDWPPASPPKLSKVLARPWSSPLAKASSSKEREL